MPFFKRDFSIGPASSQDFVSSGDWLILISLSDQLFVFFDQDSTGYDSDIVNSFDAKFQQFTLQNLDPATTVIGTAWIGTGTKPARLFQHDTSKNGQTQNDTVAGSNGLTQLVAAQSNVLAVHVSLPVDAVGPVRIGPAAIGGSSGGLAGLWLYPGQVYHLRSSAALYAYNTNSASVNIGVLQETV